MMWKNSTAAEGKTHPNTNTNTNTANITTRRRRLREVENSITLEEAEIASARVMDVVDRDACIFDVMATNDKDLAGAY